MQLFDKIQEFLIREKDIRNFQQILDVLYLYKNQHRNNEDEYLGKKISYVSISFDECAEYFSDSIIFNKVSYKRKEFIQNTLQSFEIILDNCKKHNYNALELLTINLAFELALIHRITFERCDFQYIYDTCDKFIKHQITDQFEKDYYITALNEINLFYEMAKKCEISNNSVPKDDSAYKEFCKIPISILGEFFTTLKERECVSFITKYINIEDLQFSSGERALLNFSSRIEMIDYLYRLEGRRLYRPNTNILLLIDELDLYVHPNAQRKLISSLIKQINSIFKNQNVQIIISTHSPIVLSDIPSEQSIFLNKGDSGKIVVYEGKHRQTFAANVPTLYKDSFFIEDGIGIGEYALSVINEIAQKLNNKHYEITQKQLKAYTAIINLVGEPILKSKLNEMLNHRNNLRQEQNDLSNENIETYLNFLRKQRSAIDAEIKRLENKL